MRVLLGVLIVGLAGCDVGGMGKRSGSTSAVKDADAWACTNPISLRKCKGNTLHLEGYTYRRSRHGLLITRFPGDTTVKVLIANPPATIPTGSRIAVQGRLDEVEGQPIIRRREYQILESARAKSVRREMSIGERQEMGRQALEQADAAIRQNNASQKAALAAKAVSHHVRNSGDLLIDAYTMPDGRLVICETLVYSSGAPITTCDGVP